MSIQTLLIIIAILIALAIVAATVLYIFVIEPKKRAEQKSSP